MPGIGGVIQGSAKGEGYVANEDLWADGAYSADIDAAATQAGGEAFLGDLQGGGEIGGAAGVYGGIIGMVVGALIGVVDAFVTKDAVKASLEKEQKRRIALEEELADVSNIRDEVEQNLSGLLHPLEQKFRTNMKVFGAQQAAAGVSGAQGIAGQLLAEEQYRQQIGPMLPGLMKEAKSLAREQAFQRLQEIETRENIILERRRQQLAEDQAAAAARGQFIGGLAQTATGIGLGIGGAIDDSTAAGQSQQASTSGAGAPTNAADDIYGPGAPDFGGQGGTDRPIADAPYTA